MSECSASALLVYLVQEECGFQRTLWDDRGLRFPSWWRVPRRTNNRYPSSDERVEMERGEEARLFKKSSPKARIALHW